MKKDAVGEKGALHISLKRMGFKELAKMLFGYTWFDYVDYKLKPKYWDA